MWNFLEIGSSAVFYQYLYRIYTELIYHNHNISTNYIDISIEMYLFWPGFHRFHSRWAEDVAGSPSDGHQRVTSHATGRSTGGFPMVPHNIPIITVKLLKFLHIHPWYSPKMFVDLSFIEFSRLCVHYPICASSSNSADIIFMILRRLAPGSESLYPDFL